MNLLLKSFSLESFIDVFILSFNSKVISIDALNARIVTTYNC